MREIIFENDKFSGLYILKFVASLTDERTKKGKRTIRHLTISPKQIVLFFQTIIVDIG